MKVALKKPADHFQRDNGADDVIAVQTSRASDLTKTFFFSSSLFFLSRATSPINKKAGSRPSAQEVTRRPARPLGALLMTINVNGTISAQQRGA